LGSFIKKQRGDGHQQPHANPRLPDWITQFGGWSRALERAGEKARKFIWEKAGESIWEYFSKTAVYIWLFRRFIGNNLQGMEKRQKILNHILLTGSDLQSMTGISAQICPVVKC
jgi:hypothetical protein